MRYLMLMAVFAVGCEAGGDAPVDASAPSIDAAPPPIDGFERLDADPNLACDPSNTYNWLAQRPIEPGDFCDDIQLCASSAEVAAAVVAAVPGFVCQAGPNEVGCAEGEVACVWYDPDELDADEWASLCEITVLDDPPTMRCFVYLKI